MDPSGTHNFEDQWRKALGEASETPPPAVWKGIEARLDQDDNSKLIPLWWQSRKLWYAAASVAAILLVAGLWYTNVPRNAQVPVIAKTEVPATNQNKVDDSGTAELKSEEENIAASRTNGDLLARGGKLNATDARITKRVNRDVWSTRVPEKVDDISDQNEVAVAANEQVEQQAFTENAAVSSEKTNTISAEMLAALPYSELDVHVQKRYVFFRPDAPVEEVIKPTIPKEYWAGVGVMPASFNPDVKVKEAPQAFAYQALSNQKSVSGTSEAGVGYAIQTNGGMRLSKHWSVEIGVSYLKGNSNYEGGGYVLNTYNSRAANVLEDAMAGIAAPAGPAGAPNPSKGGASFANTGVYIDVAKKVSNNYQYLQLPFQAGFTLNPDRKLSYSVLGGVMANFFLSNDLEAASGEIITTRASDEVYRSLNWAATTGLRFNYSLSSKWKASLTGSYQKAVSSGFRSNQSLEAHPYLYGVAWGVRYSF